MPFTTQQANSGLFSPSHSGRRFQEQQESANFHSHALFKRNTWPHHVACRTLVPWLGIKPVSLALEMWSQPRTTREVQSTFQASGGITFANVPLGRANVSPFHVQEVVKEISSLLLGGVAVTVQMDWHTSIGRIYGQFCNLPHKGKARTLLLAGLAEM